ncbi:MAG: hypothetical protein PHV77_03045 [Candidatus Omnitrophica bacterium]|nr:hypothetical protein [Candidatus Omnitrophota bacterium]
MSNSFRVHIALFVIIIILSLSLIRAGSHSSLVKKENADLISQHDILLSKTKALSERLDEVMAELEGQNAVLEDANNSLARERLKNARLVQDIENMKQSFASNDSAQNEAAVVTATAVLEQ